eukprot:scaffold7243_cov66-Phaeocystis_antarctica.AAC.2
MCGRHRRRQAGKVSGVTKQHARLSPPVHAADPPAVRLASTKPRSACSVESAQCKPRTCTLAGSVASCLQPAIGCSLAKHAAAAAVGPQAHDISHHEASAHANRTREV